MFRRPTKEINAEFLAEDRYLENIQRVVRETCLSVGLSSKDSNAVLLAIEEGATNIIRHAYLYETGTIRLRIVAYKKQIVFSLIDSGRSFEPSGAGTVDLDQLVKSGRKGGLGFYMIKKIMDSVEYISVGGFNELRMIKRIQPLKGQSRPFLRRLATLRVKFSFWTFLVVAVIIGGSFAYIDYRTTRQIYNHLDQTVSSLAKTIADQAAGYIINRRSDVEFDQMIVSYLRANPEMKLLVLTDSTGLIIAHSDDVRSIRKPYTIPSSIDISQTRERQAYHFEDEQLNYLIMPVHSGDRQIGLVHVVYSADMLRSQLIRERGQIGLMTALLLLFGVLAIYLLSNYFVLPIANITHRVKRFTSGDFDAELPLEGAEEFFEISKAFNQMMTRLGRDHKNIIAREKLAKEIEVASQIQKTLLPSKLPELPHMRIDAYYRAASMVGGDLYDVFEVAPDRYCLTVADVSGKGVPASMVMSMVRTVIQIFTAEVKTARQALVKVNDYLQHNIPPGMFITVILVIYEALSHKIRVVSAGHNPMFFYDAAKAELRQVNPGGMPLGVPSTIDGSFADTIEEVTLSLNDGDLFFMFTDGLSEATNKDGKRYGIERLHQFLAQQLTSEIEPKVSQLSSAITAELDNFAGYAEQSDDISFVISRYSKNSGLSLDGKSKEQAADQVNVKKLDDPGES